MQLNEILSAKQRSTPAILFEDAILTYGDLDDMSNRFANLYRSLGIGPDQRVSLLLGNDPLIIGAYFGAFKTGVIANPLHDRLAPAEISYIIDHAGSGLLITSEHYVSKVAEALGTLASPPRVLCFGDTSGLECESRELLDEQVASAPDGYTPSAEDGALLLYTSGTTGRPKGVLLTHGNVRTGAEAVQARFKLKPTDRTLCVMPMSHTNALMFSVMPFLMTGASTALCRRFSASNYWSQCRRYQVNSASISPAILSILIETYDGEDLSGIDLDFVMIASAPTPISMAMKFEALLGKRLLLESYGLTETTAVNVSNLVDGPRKYGSIGVPVPPDQVVVLNNMGKPVSIGEVGEIAIKGPSVMKGYFRDDAETAAAMQNGYLMSGDLARVDEDGFIFIVGRKKEIIVRGGENVSPLEVEHVLARHPAVSEAAVVGVPDHMYGEAICACVVRRSEVTEMELIEFCEGQLASFKVPQTIRFIDALPRNAIGKFIRKALVPYFTEQQRVKA